MSPHARQRRAFLLGSLLSVAADQTLLMAVALHVYGDTESALKVGVTFAANYGGSLLGYILIPALKERFGHARVLVATDAGCAALAFAVPWLPFPLAAAALLAYGVLRMINRPFGQALVPALSDGPAEIRSLNGALQMTNITGTSIGLLSVAVATQVDSVLPAFVASTAAFVAGTLYFARLTGVSLPAPASARRSYLERLADGHAIVVGDPLLRAAILPGSLAFGVVIAVNNQLAPIVALRGWDRLTYVAIEAATVAAIFLAGALARRLAIGTTGDPAADHRTWTLAWAGTGVCYVLFAFVHAPVPAGALLALSALGDGLSSVAQANLVHTCSPADGLEQVFALRIFFRNLGKAGMAVALGSLVEFGSVDAAVALVGAGLAAGLAVLAVAPTPLARSTT